MTASLLELIMAADIKQAGLPVPEREYQFHPVRKWRFDFAWPADKVALEVEGYGRHHKLKGFEDDCEKYNTAVFCGWRVYRFTGAMVKDARAINFIKTVILAGGD